MSKVVCLGVLIFLTACASSSEAIDTESSAGFVACVNADAHGRISDGYIIRSTGNPAVIARLFEQLLKDGVPDTAVGGMPLGWTVASVSEKNAAPLSTPNTCGPSSAAKVN